tara:strand:- start:5069 stop:6370 length:1302 start_codon:yes stop_codon:yes gene_type:complete
MNKKILSKITYKLKLASEVDKINIKDNKKKLILIKSILEKNKYLIIKSIIKDVGKPRKDAENEFKASIEIWNYVIKNIKFIRKNRKFNFSKKDEGEVAYRPLGLVAFITPWNYPLLTLSERLPFCIATGSTAIIKQSEYSQKFKNVLFKIFNKKRFSTIFHILKNTNHKIGSLLCSDENISAISFVGSTETGKKILNQTSSTLKKTYLELGGKNSAIVCESANLKLAVNEIINGIFENGGQACVGISRLIVHKKIYKKFIKDLILDIKKKHKEDQLIFQVPANKIQKRKIEKQINFIKKKYKDKILMTFNLGSNKFTPIFLYLNNTDNYFINTEFFFPIITIETFQDIKEAISKNNISKFGLAAYTFTKNKKEKRMLSLKLNSGRIWHNSALIWNPSLPVGGFGLSGQDRDMGIKGFDNYLTSKSIYNKKIYG